MNLEKSVEEIVNQECENAFLDWKFRIMAITEQFEDIAGGLIPKTELFIESHKPDFFWDYKNKINKKANLLVKKAARDVQVTIRKPSMTVDRLKLETFLLCGKNQAKAAAQLGLSRQTFHEWVKRNKDLIEAEENKTQ